jgi:hypothetical protein
MKALMRFRFPALSAVCLLVCIISLTYFVKSADASCSGCPPCETCAGDSCVGYCESGERCCGGDCLNYSIGCCNGQPCTGICCGSHCCDPASCQRCDDSNSANLHCVSRCDADNCEVCDGSGVCKSSCDTCSDCNSTTHACDSRCKPDECKECDGNGNCVSTCDPGESCCNGSCCDSGSLGCCAGEVTEPLCETGHGCGCNPINVSCSDKTERQPAGGTAYITYGTGRGCRVDEGNVPCSMWRNCTGAGYHVGELCWCSNPLVPECYCTSAFIWPYCQDCIGEGRWYTTDTRSIRCVMH